MMQQKFKRGDLVRITRGTHIVGPLLMVVDQGMLHGEPQCYCRYWFIAKQDLAEGGNVGRPRYETFAARELTRALR